MRAERARPHGPSSALEEAEFLRKVGQQVRDARARHGMTRRMLAHDSGLSERYLALLEDGRGNLTKVLLRRVAKDRPLRELSAPVRTALPARSKRPSSCARSDSRCATPAPAMG